MKKILLLFAILLPLNTLAQQFTANILVNGKDTPAEFVVTDHNNCMLGSGHNACISQYSEGSVTIPKQVTYNNETYNVMEINALAFRLCSKITSVDIPSPVYRIRDFAFVGCSSLAEVELPYSMQYIGSGAFINLPNLKKVVCEGSTPPMWDYNDVFYFHSDGISTTESVQYEKQLFVPTAAIETYRNKTYSKPGIGWVTAEGWANFATISDSQGATFRIKDADDLRTFRNRTNEGIYYSNVVLEADINLGEEAWTPIGNNLSHPFNGTFDGNGHSISGLRVVTEDFAGLFGYLSNSTVKNLIVKNSTFDGTRCAGAICGYIGDNTTIESVIAENNTIGDSEYCGGIAGFCSGTNVQISNCVVKDGSISERDDTKGLGGILAWTAYAITISNCAVLYDTDNVTASKSTMGPILAGSNENTVVNNCFSTLDLGKSDMNKVTHENCVYKGLRLWYADENGEHKNIIITPSKEETMLCVGVMGLEDWVYCPGEYPLPACFEDKLPEPKANVMTLRPSTMTTDRVNGLSPAYSQDSQETYWTDFSGGESSFLNKPFTTSCLWVDDNLTGSVINGQLPIGKAKITARQGVRYDRTLQSSPGTETISWPVFETDEDGYVVIDEYGQPVITDYEDVELDVDEPRAYPLYLPYQTTLPINCDVYRPVRLASDDGTTATIELELVDNRQIDAFKPYYVLVNSGSVTLGTTFETVVSPTTDNSISLGDDYEFTGSKYVLGATSALDNHIYLKDDDDYAIWNITSDENKQDVAAFSSYFRAKGEKKSEILLVLEHVEDDNFEYEMVFDGDDNRSLFVTKYKGEGGDIVVPASVTATVSGTERTMNVVGIADNVFEEKGDDIRSIDLSQCEGLDGVYIDRNMDGTSFYGVKETSLIFVPEDKANMGVNVVVDGVCQKLVLKEGETFYSPYEFKAKHVEYKRNMAANDFYTICLPYSAPAKDGVKYYALSGVNGATLQFDEVEQTEPGVPYLVVTTSAIEDLDFDGEDDETATDVVKTAVDGSSANGFTMHGTFTKLSPAETVGKYILQDGNKWQKAKTENAAVYIDSFHAYLTGSANARGLLDSELGGGATAIKNIHTTDKDGTEQWYDLNGHRIDDKSKKGVYIQKGKKVVLH